MSKEYKRSFRVYSAWNYQKEIEDLNEASARGWQLVRGGCFHSKFVKNEDLRFRYQLDYRKIEDMGRYIEMFREQGWEYINSTFNGWHYFRKLYDPALPEETYEIFTDRESLAEMNGRWARFALIIGIFAGLFALLCAARLFMAPTLPRLLQFLILLTEAVVLIRGVLIMRNPELSRNRRGDGALLAVFFAVLIIGAVSNIWLSGLRPHYMTSQQTDEIDEPIVDNRWLEFDVRYPDYYYLDLRIEADKPLTFEVIDEKQETVYSVTETAFQEKNIRLRLPKGKYWFSMSCESGFELDCELK